mmetsp:Transcript_68241/g.199671  ORF Transcript_68241/g.199671 Transcript_68241/m.199671 type:complete len:209 (+) Transcript_68241:1154-1780(+)
MLLAGWTTWIEPGVRKMPPVPRESGANRDVIRIHVPDRVVGLRHRRVWPTVIADVVPKQCWMVLDQLDALLKAQQRGVGVVATVEGQGRHVKHHLQPVPGRLVVVAEDEPLELLDGHSVDPVVLVRVEEVRHQHVDPAPGHLGHRRGRVPDAPAHAVSLGLWVRGEVRADVRGQAAIGHVRQPRLGELAPVIHVPAPPSPGLSIHQEP